MAISGNLPFTLNNYYLLKITDFFSEHDFIINFDKTNSCLVKFKFDMRHFFNLVKLLQHFNLYCISYEIKFNISLTFGHFL